MKDYKWLSVVESFVEYPNEDSSVIQLLSISSLFSKDPENNQVFKKSVFRVLADGGLAPPQKSEIISREEYYDSLLTLTNGSVESRIRLSFRFEGIEYLIELTESSRLAFVQIESVSHLSDEILRESLRNFPSIEVFEESFDSIEERSYHQCSDYFL